MVIPQLVLQTPLQWAISAGPSDRTVRVPRFQPGRSGGSTSGIPSPGGNWNYDDRRPSSA